MLLLLVELSRLGLASLLAGLEDGLAGPPEVGRELAEDGELAVGGKTESAEGLGDHNTLLGVIGRGDAVEHAETLEGLHPAGGLVGEHATDGALEDLGGAALVVGATAGVGVALLVHEGAEFDLVPVERARDLEGLAADSHDLLPAEELLGDNGSSTAHEVAAEVNDDGLFEHCDWAFFFVCVQILFF